MPNLKLYFSFFLIALFCTPVLLHAQGIDSLKVKINNVAINSAVVHGKTAKFPYPVLTFLTVSDTNGNYITGLADFKSLAAGFGIFSI